jgi:predicted RND superfamily exporter protein
MNFILDIFKNGIKYTILFILFVIFSIVFSILFALLLKYYFGLWITLPSNLHLPLLVILPIVIGVGLVTTIVQRVFNSVFPRERETKNKKKIDIIELANKIKKDIDDENRTNQK